MSMTEEAAKRLREPFPKEMVGKKPKKNKKTNQVIHLDYVGHAAVTDRLLHVDPEWNWEPMSFDEYGAPRLDDHGGLWIRLTVCGVTRPGYGAGDANDYKAKPDLIKEAISDALRNAAMRFGVALDLWSKEDLGDPAAPMSPAVPMLSMSDALAIRNKCLVFHKEGDLKGLKGQYGIVNAAGGIQVAVENENGDTEPLGRFIIRLGEDVKNSK